MREKKMLLNRILVVFLVLSLMLIDTTMGEKITVASADELSGDSESTEQNSAEPGTKGNPYIITEKAQLLTLQDDLEGYYELGADIVFTDEDFMEGGDFYNSGKGWEPIGSYEEPFEGVLDGKGHQIKNMKFEYSEDREKTTYENYGFFGYSKGKIKNIDFVNVEVTICRDEFFRFGVVAGENYGQILNCDVTGEINAKATAEKGFQLGTFSGYGLGMIAFCNNYANVYSEFMQADASYSSVGGIAGIATKDVWRCNNYGDVTVVNAEYRGQHFSSYAAGICGRGGMILYCSNRGNVSCGGVAAGIGGMPNNIANCCNEGNIAGGMASGICGIRSINDYVIENNYSTGTISGESYCAPIAMKSSGQPATEDAWFFNNYYLDTSIAKQESDFKIENGKALTEDQMKEQSNFVGFDFENVWKMGDNLPVFCEEVQDEGLLNIEKFDIDLNLMWSDYGSFISMPFKKDYYVGEEIDLTGTGITYKERDNKTWLFVIGEESYDYWRYQYFEKYDITPKKHGGFIATYRKDVYEVKFIDPFNADVEYFDTSKEGRVEDIEIMIKPRKTVTLDDGCTGTFSIDVKKHEITEEDVTLSYDRILYDGTSKKPSVTVNCDGADLAEGTDFEVAYSENTDEGTASVNGEAVLPGTYTITVTGIGKYKGTVVKNYKIDGISIEDAEITLDESTFQYDGAAKQPSVTVKLGEKILELNTDYEVNYQNNVNGGQANVIVQGIGIYQDSVTKTFTILAPTPTATPTAKPTPTPTVKPTPTPTVKPTSTPTVKPTQAPTVTPTVKQETMPTATPTVAPEESGEPTNTPKKSELPGVPTTTFESDKKDIQQEDTAVIESFSAQDNGKEQIVLMWNLTKSGESVSIYRSGKKSGAYKKLGTTRKEKYVDKKVNAGATYYYKICVDGQSEDKYSDVYKVNVYLKTPKAKIVKKVTSAGQKYMQITVKSWSGNRIILYAKKGSGKFKKVKLKNNRISKKKHVYNLSYTGKNQVYYFRIKTYKMIKKKKVYSRKKQYKVSK